jgi:hypothetical protein
MVKGASMELPKVIPPKTRVVLRGGPGLGSEHRAEAGRAFRVGYYSREDGLDCIWLVNDAGEYEQTVDRDYLVKHFDVVRLGRAADPFGEGEPRLRPLRKGRGNVKTQAKANQRKAG